MSEMTFKIVVTIVLGGLIVALGVSLLNGGVHPKVVPLSFGAVVVFGYCLYQIWSDFQ
ncbi:MAG: hypothetical protein AB7U75_14860 [Hyphomicrobiaceae bacterium]